MASISGLSASAPIYAQQINNFTGELFKVGGQRTPLLQLRHKKVMHQQNILEEIELHTHM